MYDLKQKWLFITGAGAGIGYETCLAFARQGCNVVATDINQAGLTKVVAAVRALGVEAHGYPLDVTDRAAFFTLAETVSERHDCPDIVINNAGILFMADITDTTPRMWQKTFDVNVMGVVNGVQAFIGRMHARQAPGYMVNISSLASKVPNVFMSAYAASKYAVEGFTDSLRTELTMADSRVRAMSVHPGLIQTHILPTEGGNIPSQSLQNLQASYDRKGSAASVVAEDIVDAVRKNKALLMTGAKSTTGYWADKLLSKKTIAKTIVDIAKQDGFVKDALFTGNGELPDSTPAQPRAISTQ